MLRRLLAAVFTLAAALVVGAAPAYADPTPPPPDECNSGGVTCTYDGTQWNIESTGGINNPFPDAPDSGPSPFAMFALFGGIALVFSGLGLYWRLSAARRMAEQAGLDPQSAVTTTLLSNDGLAATYLAANLRPRPSEDAEDAAPRVYRHIDPPTRSTESRLTELKQLHAEGLITDAEYDHRRTAIVDSV